ncbi:MAG: 23S rRNA (adenine(2503)-C(2))-methyltransferase RlmN [Candidatus Cloacimonetes bacterium]|nr:23S rRNA (adenine(2503)-C(2))-methyltransferase RlmN [Candidatus Cloacimonadota bacterium]
MRNFFAITPDDFATYVLALGEKSFRVKQVYNWVFRQMQSDFSQMTNLSEKFRAKLTAEFTTALPKIILRSKSKDGTTKYLLELFDGSKIEMVLMPSEKKNTLCVSSQVGCARACQFCATANLGLKRNLQVDEILGQVYLALKELGENRLTNIVFMGMGEPLDNYDNLVQAIKLLQNEQAFCFSPRRITVSTCGIIPKIEELAESGLKVKLAVSLNAAIDAKRDVLMPINKKYPLAELKKSLIDFRKKTNFRITFEYVMIKNFNMGKDDLKAIKRFLGDISCKINLIAWNPVDGLDYLSPSEDEIDKFTNELHVLSAAVTRRKSRGNDIDAACGQLAAKAKEASNE